MGKSWGVAAGACAIAFVTWRAACMCTCNFNGRLRSQQKPRSGKTNRKTDFFFFKERQKCEDANSLIRKHCCLFCFEAIVLNNIYLISINYCMLVTCICSGPVTWRCGYDVTYYGLGISPGSPWVPGPTFFHVGPFQAVYARAAAALLVFGSKPMYI